MRAFRHLDGVRQDFAYAARSLRRTPAVSLTIILTLALGLGANAAMFSLLDVIFLRPPAGVAQPEMLRRLWVERRFRNGTGYRPGYDYTTYSEVARSFEGQADVMLYRAPGARKLGTGEFAPSAAVSGASARYFTVLGVTPSIGRFYGADEDRLDGAAPVAVISDAFWERQFARAPAAIGQTLTFGQQRFTIIGVAPPRFNGIDLDATEVWLPLAATLGGRGAGSKTPWWRNPAVNGFQIVARLRPNAREGELVHRATAVMRTQVPGMSHDSLAVAAFGSIIAARGPASLEAKMQVAVRLAVVAVIVLLIACANVVNLLLARAMSRRREIAVRLALGISRARLMTMLVSESVLLAALATLAALAAAAWGGSLLRTLLMPEVHFASAPLHWRVLAFALAGALVAGVLVGLVPALQSASPDLTTALKSGARDGTRRSRLRDGLVMCQAALSVVLLVGAVLFVRSLNNVKSHDIGFAVDRLVFASVSYETADAARDAGMSVRLRGIQQRLAGIPGVEAVAFSSMRPKYGFSFTDYFPDIDTVGKKLPLGIYTAVSPEFFATIGTKLLRGRTFPAHGVDGPFTVIVNQAMADALWPNQNPLGRCVRFEKPTQPCATVIGVAQTALLNSIDETPSPQFYVSIDHSPVETWGASDVMVRANPSQLAAVQTSVRNLLRADFPGSIPKLSTMAQAMEPDYRPWKLGATLFTLFGVLALVVSGIGVYSTVSYATNQRTKEFGVRVALGARGIDVVRQVLSEGLRVVTFGLVLGILMALGAGRFVAALLYGIAPSDPVAMLIVAGVLLAVAALAAMAPAWRAARADPVAALRAE